MSTFADYCAEADARNTIHLNVVKYGLMLCDALMQDAPDGCLKSVTGQVDTCTPVEAPYRPFWVC
jgi:hypothetical protein